LHHIDGATGARANCLKLRLLSVHFGEGQCDTSHFVHRTPTDLSAESSSGAACTLYFVIRQVVGHVGVLTGECIVNDCRISINANALEQGALASRPAAWC